jgi:hypothetical protein
MAYSRASRRLNRRTIPSKNASLPIHLYAACRRGSLPRARSLAEVVSGLLILPRTPDPIDAAGTRLGQRAGHRIRRCSLRVRRPSPLRHDAAQSRPAHVSPGQRVADVNDLTLGNFRRRARLDPLLEDPLDDAALTAVRSTSGSNDPAVARAGRSRIINGSQDSPGFPRQPTMMDDPQRPSGYQAYRDLGRSLSDKLIS